MGMFAILGMPISVVLALIARPKHRRVWLSLIVLPFMLLFIHRHMLVEKHPPLDMAGMIAWAAERCGAMPEYFRRDYPRTALDLDQAMEELRRNGWRPYRTEPCPHELLEEQARGTTETDSNLGKSN